MMAMATIVSNLFILAMIVGLSIFLYILGSEMLENKRKGKIVNELKKMN